MKRPNIVCYEQPDGSFVTSPTVGTLPHCEHEFQPEPDTLMSQDDFWVVTQTCNKCGARRAHYADDLGVVLLHQRPKA